MSSIAKLALAIMMSSALYGCTTQSAWTVEEDNPYIDGLGDGQGRVQFVNDRTKWTIQVAKVDTERINGGLLKIYLTMRNTAQENVWTDIRTTSLDDKGHVLEQTNWEPTFFEARTVGEYTCTSMNSQAADYQILVKLPKKSSRNLQ